MSTRSIKRTLFLATVPSLFLVTLPAQTVSPKDPVGANSNSPARSVRSTPVTTLRNPGAQLSLQFEPNQGQFDPNVQFVTRTHGATVWLTQTEAVFEMHEKSKTSHRAVSRPGGRQLREAADSSSAAPVSVVRMKLGGSTLPCQPHAEERLPGTVNYFIGNDRANWRSKIPTYSQVRYANVYDGIDLVYHSNGSDLEFDFELQPNANPKLIEMDFEGVERMAFPDSGEITMGVGEGTIRLHKPAVYQIQAGHRKNVDSNFEVRGPGKLGLRIGNYDPSQALVIDPVLTYSTYLGGSAHDVINGMALDSSNNIYVAGGTLSTDFPANGYGNPPSATCVAFVTKLDPTATKILYSSFVGGTGGDSSCTWGDSADDIAVDPGGQVYITGSALSHDFPFTANAYQNSMASSADSNAFLSKLSADGASLLYSTYLGGSNSDGASGVAVDANQNAYLGGWAASLDFPVTANAFQANRSPSATAGNGFISRIDTTQAGANSLVYSSYLGGSAANGDSVFEVAVDGKQNAYLTGWTAAIDFPTTNSGFQTTPVIGKWCGFVSQLDTSQAGLSSLAYSSFLCGSYADWTTSVALDSSGSLYVTSVVFSADFPTSIGAINNRYPNDSMIGVTKVNTQASGQSSLVYSTLLGGSDNSKTHYGEWTGGLAIDGSGNAYVSGESSSSDYPVTADAAQPTLNSTGGNGVLSVLSADASKLVYSTYLGGSGPQGDYIVADKLDSASNIWVAGLAASSDFKTTPNALQPTYDGAGDGFISEFSAISVPQITSVVPTTGAAGSSVTITGSNFGGETGSVTFGGVPASIESWDATSIVFQVPASVSPGAAAVMVTTAVEPISAGTFTVVANPLAVTDASLPNAQIGVAYSAHISATGGAQPYSWSIVSGALPTGLVFNSMTAEISGHPASAATYSFTVQANDSSAPAQNASQAFSITVLPGPVNPTIKPSSTGATLSSGQAAVFNLAFQGNAADANAVFNISCEDLPQGASCSYSPFPFVLNSAGFGTSAVTISTTGNGSHFTNTRTPVLAFLFTAPALIGMLFTGSFKRQSRSLLLLLLAGALIGGISSCATFPNPSPSTTCLSCTPAGMFKVHVVATSQKPALQSVVTLQIQVVSQ